MPVTALAESARSFQFLGNQVKVHADAQDTNGQFALLEILSTPGAEPPMHVHENEDELFVVIEGKMELTCGGATRILEAGESAIARRGTPHTFKILSQSLRSFAAFTPAGFEEFFRACAGVPPTFEQLERTAARYGSRFHR